MKVLVACEESQRVAVSFREKGHEAYSCDVQEPSGGHPEWHILGDALDALRGGRIVTMDGAAHEVGAWDLLVAHPPCTYLANSSAVRLTKYIDGEKHYNPERFGKGLEAKEFFLAFLNSGIPKICVENPVPMAVWGLPEYSQIVEPFMFGEPYKKKTCLWLRGLPKLKPSNEVEPVSSWVDGGSKRADGTPRRTRGGGLARSQKKGKNILGHCSCDGRAVGMIF